MPDDVAPISRSSFASSLRRLSADEFVSFVADLWAARGWSTEVRGDVVVATREEPAADRHVLLVRHDAPLLGRVRGTSGGSDVTHVVTSGRGSASAREAAAALDANLFERDDLYDMAVYALDPEVREDRFQRHLGRSATVTERPGALDPVGASLGGPRGVFAALATVLVLVAVLAGAATLLDGTPIPDASGGDALAGTTPTPRSFDVSASTATASPESPTPDDGARSSDSSTVGRLPNETIGAGDSAWPVFRGGPARTGHGPRTDGPRGPVDVLATFTTDRPIHSSPAVVNGTVYVGARDGKQYALDARSLDVVWEVHVGGWVASSPAVVDGTVYVGSVPQTYRNQMRGQSATHRLHAIDSSSGWMKWEAETRAITASSPVVAGETVYVGSTDDQVYAVDVNGGAVAWSTPTNGSVVSSPAVAHGIVYVGSVDGRLYALDAESGAVEWSTATEDSVVSTPAVANGTVYVGSMDGGLYALDAGNGSINWRRETGAGISSSPAVANGTVFVGSHDGHVYAFDADSGRQRWTYPTGGDVIASPTVANGTVYVGSTDGWLYALDARTGDERWTFDLGETVQSSPAVVDGIVYVGDDGGTVTALAEIDGK